MPSSNANSTDASDAKSSAMHGRPLGMAKVISVRPRELLTAIGVLVFGVVMTFAASMSSVLAEKAEARVRFDLLTERLTTEAQRRVNQPRYGLAGARGVYAASSSVQRAEFEAYVGSRQLSTEFPGVVGIGFIERVMRKDLDAFVARERADGAPDFAVHGIADVEPPLPAMDDLYVIKHCYPRERNARAWGVDVGTERHRREAIELAVRSGEPRITAKITLVQDDGNRPGFLYCLPVYANGTHAKSPEERIATLTGLVYAAVILEETLAGVTDTAGGQLDFEIFDGETLCKEMQLFDGDGHLNTASGDITHTDYQGRMFHAAKPLVIGGRTWTFSTSTTPKFDATVSYSTAITLGMGGLLLSVLAAGYWYVLSTSIAIARGMASELATAKAAAESALREVGVLHSTLNAHSIVSVADSKGRIIAVNKEFCRISGYASEELIGQDHRILNSGVHPKEFWVDVWRALASGQAWRGEVCNRAKNGTLYWVDSIIAPFMGPGGKIEKYVSIRNDITTRKAAERELETMALTDRLTGLPNRALMMDRLERVMVRSAREGRATYAVLFLDFDRFKIINDTMGHEAGDMLLVSIAERLRRTLRSSDSVARIEATGTNTTARLGGDEFVVVLDGLARPEDADVVADMLVRIMSEPHVIAGQMVVSTASIGVVRGDPRYRQVAEVLRDADTAMYHAKSAGRGRYMVFDEEMREKLARRQALERDIRGVTACGELSLRFLPVLDITGARVDSIEALVRWDHPVLGLVVAAEFIPIAEEVGEIASIGAWVMESVCASVKAWRAEFGTERTPKVSVNLSWVQFCATDLVQQLTRVLEGAGLGVDAVGLEISERIVTNDPKAAVPVMQQLRDAGFTLALDDFGTGYTSLPMLHELPIHTLKLDSTFVASAARGREYTSLAQVVVTLAGNLSMSVVAEGVETPEQLAVLQALDCRLAQGRLLAKEMTEHEIAVWLRNGQITVARQAAA